MGASGWEDNIMIVKKSKRAKYLFITCGLTLLFFALCGSICITDGTLALTKDGYGTSV
jgi:hypothetical protein